MNPHPFLAAARFRQLDSSLSASVLTCCALIFVRPCIHLASRHLFADFEERVGVRAWPPPVAHGEGDDARRCEVQVELDRLDAADIALVRGAPLGQPLA